MWQYSSDLWHLRSFRKILEEYLCSTFMMSYYLMFNLHSLLSLTFDFLIHLVMYNNFILILTRTSVKTDWKMKSTVLIVPCSNISSIVTLFHSVSSSLINTINVLLNKSESFQSILVFIEALYSLQKLSLRRCEILKGKSRSQKSASWILSTCIHSLASFQKPLILDLWC